VVLDEAGAVGIDDMKRLFDLACNARVVLSGDTGQHASVARGDALRILERHSNFKSGQLTAIRRQRKAAYRKAWNWRRRNARWKPSRSWNVWVR